MMQHVGDLRVRRSPGDVVARAIAGEARGHDHRHVAVDALVVLHHLLKGVVHRHRVEGVVEAFHAFEGNASGL